MQPKYQLGRLPDKLWIAECKITAWTEENKFFPKVSLIGMTWLDVWGGCVSGCFYGGGMGDWCIVWRRRCSCR